MFLNRLYQINQLQTEDNGLRISAQIELNPSHEIFIGHFPGNPILPGVCVVQILKELLVSYLNHELILKNASSIKFLSIIDPTVNGNIQFDIEMDKTENGDISCKAVLNSGSLVFCRFKGEFKVITKHVKSYYL